MCLLFYTKFFSSGSMRAANDLIVFTKKNEISTILFVSQTFLETEKIDGVSVE